MRVRIYNICLVLLPLLSLYTHLSIVSYPPLLALLHHRRRRLLARVCRIPQEAEGCLVRTMPLTASFQGTASLPHPPLPLHSQITLVIGVHLGARSGGPSSVIPRSYRPGKVSSNLSRRRTASTARIACPCWVRESSQLRARLAKVPRYIVISLKSLHGWWWTVHIGGSFLANRFDHTGAAFSFFSSRARDRSASASASA